MVAFPTRVQKVGNLYCLFLSCVRNGELPVMSIGPNWPFTVLLFIFVLLILIYIGFMIRFIWKAQTVGCCLIIAVAVVNIVVLLIGILSDPGVPDKVYKRYSRFYSYTSESSSAIDENDSEQTLDTEVATQNEDPLRQRIKRAGAILDSTEATTTFDLTKMAEVAP